MSAVCPVVSFAAVVIVRHVVIVLLVSSRRPSAFAEFIGRSSRETDREFLLFSSPSRVLHPLQQHQQHHDDGTSDAKHQDSRGKKRGRDSALAHTPAAATHRLTDSHWVQGESFSFSLFSLYRSVLRCVRFFYPHTGCKCESE